MCANHREVQSRDKLFGTTTAKQITKTNLESHKASRSNLTLHEDCMKAMPMEDHASVSDIFKVSQPQMASGKNVQLMCLQGIPQLRSKFGIHQPERHCATH